MQLKVSEMRFLLIFLHTNDTIMINIENLLFLFQQKIHIFKNILIQFRFSNYVQKIPKTQRPNFWVLDFHGLKTKTLS